MGLLRLRYIEYWACISGVALGGLLGLILEYSTPLSSIVSDKEPILMRMSFSGGESGEGSALVISEFVNTLDDFDDIRDVKVFRGQTDAEDSNIAYIYNSEVLFEILRHERRLLTLNKNQLIKKLNELAAYAYPGVDLKLIQGSARPSVFVRDVYSSIQIKFIPDQEILGQMNIDEDELNKQLGAYIRLAPPFISLEYIQDFGFVPISEGRSIPFGTLGEFKPIQVEHKLEDLPSGHWKPMTNDRNSGIIIKLSLGHINVVGLGPLSTVEIKIKKSIDSLGQKADLESVGKIIMMKSNDIELMLKDIARVEIGYLDEGEPYSIFWQKR